MKTEIDKSLPLAYSQKENQNAVAYGCHDIKKTQCTNTFHNESKNVFEPMFVLESKREEKIKS